MRKLLLVTTALVGFSAAAQAASAPIAVTVGGDVDFRAAMFHESAKSAVQLANNTTDGRSSSDFTTLYHVDIDAAGKANNGVEYGAKIGLTNDADGTGANDTYAKEAYVYMSGNFGKAVLGDAHTADVDMFVSAPSVGLGQATGDYDDFLDTNTYAKIYPTYFSNDDTSTSVTFYTPKVGNENHKVQLGASFTPHVGDSGDSAVKYENQTEYKDRVGAALQYTGKFSPVTTTVSATYSYASGDNMEDGTGNMQQLSDYSMYGIGAQATYAGVTVGGSYVDAGHAGKLKNTAMTKDQDVWTLGAKYGFDKVEVAANYKNGEGYSYFDDAATGYVNNAGYVKKADAVGLGATYTWFPGMTTAADVVFFEQKFDNNTMTDAADNNTGNVFMVSQKLAF